MKRVLLRSLVVMLACGSTVFAAGGAKAGVQAAAPDVYVQSRDRGSSFMGVGLQDVNDETVQRLKLKEERGALVNEIVADGPAAKAGLQRDDVIVKWDGERVESAIEVYRLRRETPAGRAVRLGVIRDGREIEINITLGERTRRPERVRIRPERPERPARVYVRERGRLGASLQNLSPQLAEYFGVSRSSGALVASVEDGSPAGKAGLKAGDVIVSIGGEAVSRPSDVRRALRVKVEGPVEVKVVRERQERSFTVQLEKSSATTSWVNFDDFDDLDMDLDMDLDIDIDIDMPEIDIDLPTITLPRIAPVTIPAVRIAPMAIPMPRIRAPRIRVVSHDGRSTISM